LEAAFTMSRGGGVTRKVDTDMKSKFRFGVLLIIAAIIAAGSAGAASKGKLRKGEIVKGKPAILFVGEIKQIVTNTLPFQIVVDGTSNSSVKDPPKGSVTFDVQASCRIKSDGGKTTGKFSDLQKGQRIAISYAEEVGSHFAAQAIDLDAPAAPAKTETKKKK
jgi:hypothetical protein